MLLVPAAQLEDDDILSSSNALQIFRQGTSAAHRPPPIRISPSVFGMSGLPTPSSPARSSSNRGFIVVLGYTPQSGQAGSKLSAVIEYRSPDELRLRIVVGTQQVTTQIRRLDENRGGTYQLEAIIPEPSAQDGIASGRTVPLSVEAVNADGVMMDGVSFGYFMYQNSGATTTVVPALFSPVPRAILKRPGDEDFNIITNKRSREFKREPSTPPPSLPTPDSSPPQFAPIHAHNVPPASDRQLRRQAPSRLEHLPVFQSTPSAASSSHNSHGGLVTIVTPLDSMCSGWSAQEKSTGRRLVRFYKIRQGNDAVVRCEPISQRAFDETDIEGRVIPDEVVVSCIHRRDAGAYCITSVDIIVLLELLEGIAFNVDEKGRIRRNLDGLKPTTIAKHRAETGPMFTRIMDFPRPRPRNIEKDIKVFEWGVLAQALEKIMSKQSIFTSTSPVVAPLRVLRVVPEKPTPSPTESSASTDYLSYSPASSTYSADGTSTASGPSIDAAYADPPHDYGASYVMGSAGYPTPPHYPTSALPQQYSDMPSAEMDVGNHYDAYGCAQEALYVFASPVAVDPTDISSSHGSGSDRDAWSPSAPWEGSAAPDVVGYNALGLSGLPDTYGDGQAPAGIVGEYVRYD